jgi:hypothetical protein
MNAMQEAMNDAIAVKNEKDLKNSSPAAIQELVYGSPDLQMPSLVEEAVVEKEKAPDVELTYEEYLALRPVAQEGDMFHKNGKVRNALTGAFASKAAYQEKLVSTNADDYYDSVAMQGIQQEAMRHNEIVNDTFDTIIRDNTEGELLIDTDPRLKGLYALGIEMLTLYNSDEKSEKYEKSVKPLLEAKKAIYDDLYELYDNKGLDDRALGFIYQKTIAHVDDPKYVPVEGSPYFGGEKVKVLEVTENPDKKLKSYTIEKDDGSIEAVYASDVNFKREYQQAEVEPELSRTERIKNWSKKEISKFRKYGGGAYFGEVWNRAGNWLTSRNITEEMTDDEAQQQKERNRRNLKIGFTAAAIVAGTAAIGGAIIGINHGLNVNNLDHNALDPSNMTGTSGSGAIETHGSVATMERVTPDAVPPPFDSGAAFPPSEANINNAAYDIPQGGGGLNLFDKLGLGEDTWKQSAHDLVDKFPNDFNRSGSDVRIAHAGWISPEARAYIESLKTS